MREVGEVTLSLQKINFNQWLAPSWVGVLWRSRRCFAAACHFDFVICRFFFVPSLMTISRRHHDKSRAVHGAVKITGIQAYEVDQKVPA